MKIVMPIAGTGSRLKPHTFTTPKPLMDVAGMPILERVIRDSLKLNPDEIIFVVGYKRNSIKEYIKKFHPKLKCSFVEQKKRDGDGSAVRIALEKIEEEDDLYIIFAADTLIDFDMKKALNKIGNSDGLVFGMEVEKPQNYGIMNLRSNGEIYEVEEKPEKPKSNLAIIGAYYFKSLQTVKKMLNDFYKKEETVKNEYKVVQVIDKYIKTKNLSIKGSKVNEWFDCGRVEVLLEANQYFLKKQSNGKITFMDNNIIIPPSYVSKDAKVKNSIIGPYASISAGCIINDSIIKNSIVNFEAELDHMNIKHSLIGKHAKINGKAQKINIGDKSEISFN
ncbi:MAG: NTP transferase domain-containing protein [Nanoarchaeota archaeon]|nr:NTP transferase domain-containing protein [Nanoarchaeota archaeon]